MNDKLIYARALEILDEIDGMIPCCLRSDGRGGETEYSLTERVDILLQSIPKAEAECDRLRAARDAFADEHAKLTVRVVKLDADLAEEKRLREDDAEQFVLQQRRETKTLREENVKLRWKNQLAIEAMTNGPTKALHALLSDALEETDEPT